MRNKTAKERLMAIALTIAVAAVMIPGVFLLSSQDAEAVSTITLTGKKFEYKDEYGDWHTNTYFSGSGYEGLCAKAHYHAITGKHSYSMYDSSNYCKSNIMAKLAYHYGYRKGWTSGTNGAKLARCLNYVSTQSGAKDRGKAFNFKEKTLKDMVAAAKDVTVPDGFECWFVIPKGDTGKQAAVIWKYTPPGSLTLVKSSAVTGYKKSFAGCEYTVCKSDKKTVAGKLICKADGTTNTLSLQPGTYYVKETKTNANYLLSDKWYTAKVTSKKTIKVKASDGAQGNVSIQKAFTPDSDEGYTLEGFRFTLRSTADSKRTYSGTTDKNGRISIKDLKAGTYTVTEKLTAAQQDAGYSNESAQGQKVTIENGKTTQITWKNSYSKSNKLVIVKTTSDGSPVSGFRFDIKGDIAGRELTMDTFTALAHITPAVIRDGFTLGDFQVDEAELADLNNAAENKETGTCTVHVTAEATGPAVLPQGEPLESFLEEEDSYVFEEGDVLDYNGTVYIAQVAMTYSLDQIQGTGGEECLLEDENFFRTGEPQEITETITVPVKVTLLSIRDQDNVTEPVLANSISEPEGWTIGYNDIIWAGSADSYHKNDDETVTKENGMIRISDILPGTYTVTEELTEEQQKRYRTPAPQTLTLKAGEEAEPIIFEVENQTKTTPVSLVKTNVREGGEIEGFEFTLTGTRAFDGVEIEPVTALTDEAGRIDFGELYAGSYVMEETGFDPSAYVFHQDYRLEGHDAPAKAFTVTGEEAEPIGIAFENDPITSLRITKVDEETQMFLDGAVFDLYENDEKVVTFRIVRGSDGKALADIVWEAEGSMIHAGTEEAGDAGSGTEEESSAIEETGGETAETEGAVEYNYAVLKGLKRHAAYRIVETDAPAGYAGTVDYGFTFEENMDPIILENGAPQIRTEARDAQAGLHMSNASGGPVSLIDTVLYKGLTPGKTYAMTGRLMFKPEQQTGADVQNEDASPVVSDGKAVESTTVFTPTEKDGSVAVRLTFDASELEGAKTVIFESLRDPVLGDGSVIATHSEADNEDQSIYFPELHTTATGGDTGMHLTGAGEGAVIADTVEYNNVIAGRIYEIRGTLMEQETGDAVTEDGQPVTATVRFKATEDGPVCEEGEPLAEDETGEVNLVSGSAELLFPFDSEQYAGKSLVVFEELYTGGELVGEHKDLADEAQTVQIPAIQTKASAGRNAIKDKVTYENLIPGETYLMRGVLMDKAAGEPALSEGEEITSELAFTPHASRGSVKLKFDTDTSGLEGRTLVAFETCCLLANEGEVEIARHHDLEAKSQTVTVGTPQTGQTIPWTLPAALAGVIASSAYLLRRTRIGR